MSLLDFIDFDKEEFEYYRNDMAAITKNELVSALEKAIKSPQTGLAGSSIDSTAKEIRIYVTKENAKNRVALLQGLYKFLVTSDASFRKAITKDEEHGSTGRLEFNGDTKNFIVLKPPRNAASSGSGGGQYQTALQESAQCYYCACAWYGNGSFTDAELRKHAGSVQASFSGKPVTVDDVITKLSDEWKKSCSITAKKIADTYKNGKMARGATFHRDSSYVASIGNCFKVANKKEGDLFANLNKWTPADIYIVSSSAPTFNPQIMNNFDTLNATIKKSIEDNTLLPFSLKLIENDDSCNISKVNFNIKTRPRYDFAGSTYGKVEFFGSMDCYIFYSQATDNEGMPIKSNKDTGEIQFRDFGGQWQGEAKGKKANHGKISAGPLQTILRDFNINLTSSSYLNTQATSLIRKAKEDFKKLKAIDVTTKNTFVNNFYSMYKEAYKGQRDLYNKSDFFLLLIEEKKGGWQTPSWIRSKFLGTELLLAVNKMSDEKKNEFVNAMINYAKSQSPKSAPHLKAS